MIQYQILQTSILRIVWQTVRRIANGILGVKGLKTKFSEKKVRTLMVTSWTTFHIAGYALQAVHGLPSCYSTKEKFLWMTNLYPCRCAYFSLHIKGWRMQRIAKETWSKHLKTCTWCTQVGVIDFNINFFCVCVCESFRVLFVLQSIYVVILYLPRLHRWSDCCTGTSWASKTFISR